MYIVVVHKHILKGPNISNVEYDSCRVFTLKSPRKLEFEQHFPNNQS